MAAQEQNSQLVFIQALKPPPKSFLAFATLAAASALPITVVSGSRRGQEARLCLTEPVTCPTVTSACRRLATRRAASAKPARRCQPPSAAELAELSCPGKSPLAASQAPGAGARLPEAAARGGGERGRG